jgi:hypothetical protein
MFADGGRCSSCGREGYKGLCFDANTRQLYKATEDRFDNEESTHFISDIPHDVIEAIPYGPGMMVKAVFQKVWDFLNRDEKLQDEFGAALKMLATYKHSYPKFVHSAIDIVFDFDGPPSHTSGRFVGVERDGESIAFGKWMPHPKEDGYWVLRLPEGSVFDFAGEKALKSEVAQLGFKVEELESKINKKCFDMIKSGGADEG